MNDLPEELEKIAIHCYDEGRSDFTTTLLVAASKIRAAEALALSVAEHPAIDFHIWEAVKAYRKAGSVTENTQKSTPA